jgi:hypothetical protein
MDVRCAALHGGGRHHHHHAQRVDQHRTLTNCPAKAADRYWKFA